MVYAIVNRDGATNTKKCDSKCESSRLIQAVESELSDGDAYTVIKPGHLVFTLSSTSEFGAMQFARLLRSAFQRHDLSSRKQSISIGLLLHGLPVDESTEELLDVARELVETADKTAGNIECLILNT